MYGVCRAFQQCRRAGEMSGKLRGKVASAAENPGLKVQLAQHDMNFVLLTKHKREPER